MTRTLQQLSPEDTERVRAEVGLSRCPYCDAYCPPNVRFDHERWWRDNETVIREQAGAGVR